MSEFFISVAVFTLIMGSTLCAGITWLFFREDGVEYNNNRRHSQSAEIAINSKNEWIEQDLTIFKEFLMERDFETYPYSKDEQRVAEWLMEHLGIGGGDDPIGFLLASLYWKNIEDMRIL